MSFRHRFKINFRRKKRMGFGENRRIRKAIASKNYARAWQLSNNRSLRVMRRK